MSNLYEALRRGRSSIGEIPLDQLLEGQSPEPQHAASVTLAPAPARVPEPLSNPLPASGGIDLDLARLESLSVVPSLPILPFDGTHQRAAEQYRILRTKLIQHPNKPKLVVITSAAPGDGKSVTAINLAGALALKNESRVLLLDADFRRSNMAATLGISDQPGLSNVLRGDRSFEDCVVRAAQIPNLFVLVAGKTASNPGELLDSSRWAALCIACRETFEYVIVDSPPLGAVADYDLIQAPADGVLLVLRPDHTARSMCFKTIGLIPKEKSLGAILNCVRPWGFNRQPGYGEYYYQSKMGVPAAGKRR